MQNTSAQIFVIKNNKVIRKGSGLFLKIKESDSYPAVFTNLHLLFDEAEWGNKIRIKNNSGNSFDLPYNRIAGFDYMNDVAVIEQDKFKPAKLHQVTKRKILKGENLFLFYNGKPEKLKYSGSGFIHHLNIVSHLADGDLKKGYSGSGVFDGTGKIIGIVKSRLGVNNDKTNLVIPGCIFNEIYLKFDKKYVNEIICFNRAYLNYKNGNFIKAEKLFKDYIYLNPEDTKGYYHLGNLYNRIAINKDSEKHYKTALDYYYKTISINSNHCQALFNLGIVHEYFNELSKSLSFYNSVLKLEPRYVKAYLNRGNVYNKLGKKREAKNDYSQAIKTDKNYPDAYINRGTLYDELGNLRSSIKDFMKAYAINPVDSELLASIGNYYRQVDDNKKALKFLNKAIKINPSLYVSFFYRGEIYLKQNNLPGAIGDFSRSVQMKNNFYDGYFRRGLCYYKLGSLRLAKKDFEMAVKLNSNYLNKIKEELAKLE